MLKTMKVAVLGATGFTGEKLIEILIKHKFVEINYLTSRVPNPISYSELFPRFKGRIFTKCERLDISKALKKADFFFLALPHTVSMQVVPLLIEAKKKVVDLSADYRIEDASIYNKFYNTLHTDKKNLRKAVYGLPEFFKDKIKRAVLVANPGCYPTSVILALAPLVKEKVIKRNIIVDAKSSITGAGRKAVIDYHFSNISGNIWAYKPFSHQHLPEIIQAVKGVSGLACNITFVPHVVGIESGIYSTIYLSFKKKVTQELINSIYIRYYRNAPFVRILNRLPKLKDVVGTNFCDIGFSLKNDGLNAVVASCIDNLIKGAAGNAVQNMNIMCGFSEKEALLSVCQDNKAL